MTRPASVDSSLVLSRSSSLFFVVFFALSHFSMAEQQSAERADSGSPRSRAVAAAVAAAVAKANSCNDESSSPTAQAAAAATYATTTKSATPLWRPRRDHVAAPAPGTGREQQAQPHPPRARVVRAPRGGYRARPRRAMPQRPRPRRSRRDLAAGARLSAVPAPPLGAAEAAAAEEMREWKVRYVAFGVRGVRRRERKGG